MSRTLWFVAGAAASAYALSKARRAADAFTPDGLRDRLSALSLGVHLLTDEVRTEAQAKEEELRTRLRLAHDGPAGIDAGPSAPHLQLTKEGST